MTDLSRLARPQTWRSVFSTQTVVWFSLGLYLLLTGTYVVWGRHNIDEGWYLYAAQQVWRGQLPYRDFAFTQMPAVPYLYGLPLLIFGPHIYVGRLTTVALGLAQFAAGVALARRSGGDRAAALASVLLATYSTGIYFETIAKTYALAALCLTMALLCVPSSERPAWRWALAVAWATLAALTRFSAAAFWLPIMAFSLLRVRGWRSRLALVAVAATLALPGLFLLTRDPAATWWNLYSFHLGQWSDPSLRGRLSEIALLRLPVLMLGYAPQVALLFVAAVSAHHNRHNQPWSARTWLAVVSLSGFVLVHFTNGVWYLDYLLPAVAAGLPLVAVGLVRAWQKTDSAFGRIALATYVSAMCVWSLRPNYPATLNLGERPAPVEEVRAVAQVVAEHAAPGQQVLALETLSVVFEAARPVVPGFEMASFALQGLNDEQAEALHVTTPSLLRRAIEHEAARVVILTGDDWMQLESLNAAAPLRLALEAHYSAVWAMDGFGQFNDRLVVYLCRTCP